MLDLSLEQMQTAWEHVRENAGCPGVDGVTVEAYQRQAETGLPELLVQSREGAYLPLPLRKVVVKKKPGSKTFRLLLIQRSATASFRLLVARLPSPGPGNKSFSTHLMLTARIAR